ncbi:ParB N-terminal domain-containing protein, partial [Neisseria meningitidis]|nr:ParB N-terminal domain-containing protein [Neisseria meningitidis]
MKTDIQTELTQALLPHEKVWANEEKTILAKNILLDLVEKTDPTIIGLLLGNDELKRHFFVEVNGVLVFKLQDFRFFLDKHSVNNSYTKYANRIGLTVQIDDEALQELADSIKAQGVIQPVIVREHGLSRYELIAGERR